MLYSVKIKVVYATYQRIPSRQKAFGLPAPLTFIRCRCGLRPILGGSHPVEWFAILTLGLFTYLLATYQLYYYQFDRGSDHSSAWSQPINVAIIEPDVTVRIIRYRFKINNTIIRKSILKQLLGYKQGFFPRCSTVNLRYKNIVIVQSKLRWQ